MKKNNLLLLICGLIIAACSNNKDKPAVEFCNDLENLKGWSGNDNNVKAVVKEKPRSGSFSSKTDSANRFGYIFKTSLGDVSKEQLKSVKASVWALIPQINNEAVLVINVDSVNKNIFWQAQKLSDFVKKTDEWTEVKALADLSQLKPSKDYVISVYVWNTGSTEIYTDDYCVKFYK